MNEKNTITLYAYENALSAAAIWVARIAHLRGATASNAPMGFRWFSSYGLKVEIRSGHSGLAAVLRDADIDVHKVLGSSDAFWQRNRLETHLCQSIARIVREGLPQIAPLNAITVCGLPFCANAQARTATICEPINKKRWACEDCITEIEAAQTSKSHQRSLVTPKLRYEVLARDRFACCACGSLARPEANITLHVDHIHPITEGGQDRIG